MTKELSFLTNDANETALLGEKLAKIVRSRDLIFLQGDLGSGKTTLINNILQNTQRPIGVLVNDFGELNIDEKLILNQDDLTISLTNGCVCCNLNDDLGASLNFMLNLNIEAVILESSGVALPIKMSNYGSTWPGYTLNRTITVVEGNTLSELLLDKFVCKSVEARIIQSDLIYLNRFTYIVKKIFLLIC